MKALYYLSHMRIACITDLHISKEHDLPYGVDTRKNFLNILAELQEEDIDRLIILGDLCLNNGNRAIYNWIYDQLEATQIPYVVIAGNHDNSRLMAESLAVRPLLKNDYLYYRNDFGKTPALYLDTSPGLLSEDQLKWLKKQIKGYKKTLYIFMHHPPLEMGVHYMDDHHSLRNKKELIKLLIKHKYPVHIFSGHYHVERSRHFKNIHVHITPSCFYQIKAAELDHEIDHYDIAYRIIEILNGEPTHFLNYIPGAVELSE